LPAVLLTVDIGLLPRLGLVLELLEVSLNRVGTESTPSCVEPIRRLVRTVFALFSLAKDDSPSNL